MLTMDKCLNLLDGKNCDVDKSVFEYINLLNLPGFPVKMRVSFLYVNKKIYLFMNLNIYVNGGNYSPPPKKKYTYQ